MQRARDPPLHQFTGNRPECHENWRPFLSRLPRYWSLRMNTAPCDFSGLSAPAAVAVASCAFAVPLLLSLPAVPAPNHPRVLLWYKSLREPSFKPPDLLFPVAWTAIEAALALAGYRLSRAAASPAKTKALALWGWNIFMIGSWSQLFFKKHLLGVSTVAAAGLVATSAAFVHQANQIDRTSSRAGLPLLGWAAFATVLTATIWYMNPRKSR